MKRSILVISFLIYFFNSSYAQNSLDSFIKKFLIAKDQMNTAINTKTKSKEGGFLKKANYFSQKKPAIHLSDTSTLQPVIFGCYKSHAPKFLLVAYKTGAQEIFYVYGEDRLLLDLNKLQKELLEGIKADWGDDETATLISYLSLCYK